MTSAQPQPSEFHHPDIGIVKGGQVGGVRQFLGIKYASLRHWFDNARLSTYDGSGIIADHHGPQAISDPQGLDNEFVAIQKALPKTEFPGLSGTDCLNLNIWSPEGATADSALPVLVYIHGGGFVTGANWWPQFDMKRIVQLSVKLGKPIIGININYRLGAPGFMDSAELREAGYHANRGHHDQRLALQWVKAYIGGFGGDPSRVTVSGESAGGLSTTRLLYTDEALASRIVVLGGAPPSVPPLSASVADSTYTLLSKTIAYHELLPDERLKALENLSISDISTRFPPGVPFVPVLDDNLVPYSESFSLMASKEYAFKAKQSESAMIVYSPLDASIFAFMGLPAQRKDLAAGFTKSLHLSLGQHQSAVEQLLQLYGITPGLDDETALLHALQFGSDIGFQAAAHALAESFPADAFVMRFSEPNPWDGPFKGHSTHILDIAFLLQNFNEHLDEAQRAAAVQFGEDVIGFVNGQKPWKAYSAAKGISILEAGRRRYVEGSEAISERYRGLLKIGEVVGLDGLFQAFLAFLFTP
ncbi:hypothetical protein ACJZ2D_002158 [Fusarium nematophilum]